MGTPVLMHIVDIITIDSCLPVIMLPRGQKSAHMNLKLTLMSFS